MRRNGFLAAVISTVVITLLPVSAAAVGYGSPVNDVSWPNCLTNLKQLSNTGIVGVSGGLDFRNNPCLAKEASWFSRYGLYINTGYPGAVAARKFINSPLKCSPADNLCLAYNYGYNAALFAVNYANSQLVHSPSWWLDVETDNSWDANYLINREDIQGAQVALDQEIFLSTVGIYSSPYQWQVLTNNWLNGLPVWLATGSSSPLIARSYCANSSFSGGQIWLSQYTTYLDDNVLCNNSFGSLLNNLQS